MPHSAISTASWSPRYLHKLGKAPLDASPAWVSAKNVSHPPKGQPSLRTQLEAGPRELPSNSRHSPSALGMWYSTQLCHHLRDTMSFSMAHKHPTPTPRDTQKEASSDSVNTIQKVSSPHSSNCSRKESTKHGQTHL